jgi:uncharacterized protein with FMN-binding domain
VVASCAAILAVYAAGYLRTRDEARGLDAASQARRPLQTVRPPVAQVAAAAPVPARKPGIEPMPATSKSLLPAVSPPRPLGGPPSSRDAPLSESDTPAVSAIPSIPEEPIQPPATQAVVVATPEPAPAASSESPWHDGTYTGWGLSRHGDIEARVTIKHGGIVAVGIATCATRYPCYVIDEILQQPLFRQSADVDRVSRATESADAYSDAVWQALQKAEAGPVAGASP